MPDNRVFPDAICGTCIYYEDGICKLNDVDVSDQDCCDEFLFDGLCVDCGSELGHGTMVSGLLSCRCTCCGTINVGPAGFNV